MLLDLFPFFTVHFERLKEAEVLVTRPSARGLGSSDRWFDLHGGLRSCLDLFGRLSACFCREHLAGHGLNLLNVLS